jgi:Fe-S oxidoreductase
LFEMLRGDPIKDGWQSAEVEDALSLCLACKGCKSDCPVNVDMATYKAEFRYRYYHHRPRPRAAYSMGLIHAWSRAGGILPSLANTVTHTAGLSAAVKWAGGIAQDRRMPAYADEPFQHWFEAHRAERRQGGQRVVLWPDTFNNFFRPATAVAATRVLEAAGFTVVVPRPSLCCGRPLYDWGMLDAAKRLWRRTFEALRPEIEAGVPVVGLEPACTSAFRDELPNLFPTEPLARWLHEQTFQFGEFLHRHLDEIPLPRLKGNALVHVHCHHHAVIGYDSDKELLGRLGLDFRILSSGCCGMAGSFVFEECNYDLSMKLAERVLLPAVRQADPATLIVTDGFSCREQIEQGSDRRTRHVAEVIADAL